MATKKKGSYSYPEVPKVSRRMLLVRYDAFPFMLLHQAHRLEGGSYRWVSSWGSGHQNLGVFLPDVPGLLAVMPVEEGEKLSDELEALRQDHYLETKKLDQRFMSKRNVILAAYHVSAGRPGGKDAQEGT